MKLTEILQLPYKGFTGINVYHVNKEDLKIKDEIMPIVKKYRNWYPERYRPHYNIAKRLAKIIAILKQANCDLYMGYDGGGSAYSYEHIAVPIQQVPQSKLPELIKYSDVIWFQMDGRHASRSYTPRIFMQFSVKYMKPHWNVPYTVQSIFNLSRLSRYNLHRFYNKSTCKWNLSFISTYNH